MAKLIYSAIASLDGYIEDERGKFDWAAPDEEVHSFINDLLRSVGTHLYGRRMYETMAGWGTDPTLAAQSRLMQDFAQIWQAADKIVYSETMDAVPTLKTRIERVFDPESVQKMKASAADDLTVAGPNLAAHAFKAGLVDECHLFVVPIMVGGGKQSLPDNVRMELELLDHRRSAAAWFICTTGPELEVMLSADRARAIEQRLIPCRIRRSDRRALAGPRGRSANGWLVGLWRGQAASAEFGPVLHVHTREDESVYVIDGVLTIVVGDERFEAIRGEFVWLPRGVPHTFANLGDAPVHVVGAVVPAGLAGMFEEQFAYVASLKGPPDEAEIAKMGAKYGVSSVGRPLSVADA